MNIRFQQSGDIVYSNLYVDGIYTGGLQGVNVYQWIAPGPNAPYRAHTFEVKFSDDQGNWYSSSLKLYEVVKATGTVLDYLPANSVPNSPFHEDNVLPYQPLNKLSSYFEPSPRDFRERNEVTVEAKRMVLTLS